MITTERDRLFLESAVQQAFTGASEGGLPIGAALAISETIVSLGRNRREQLGNPILHAEMDCIANAGRLSAESLSQSTIYSSLWPCKMCAGAIALFKIKRVVVADDGSGVAFVEDWRSSVEFLESNGIDLEIITHQKMIRMFRDWLIDNADCWKGDVGGL